MAKNFSYVKTNGKKYLTNVKGQVVIYQDYNDAIPPRPTYFYDDCDGLDGVTAQKVNTVDFIISLAKALNDYNTITFDFFGTPYTVTISRKKSALYFSMYYIHRETHSISVKDFFDNVSSDFFEKELFEWLSSARLIPARMCSGCGKQVKTTEIKNGFFMETHFYCDDCLVNIALASGLLNKKTIYYDRDGKEIGNNKSFAVVKDYVKNLMKEGNN